MRIKRWNLSPGLMWSDELQDGGTWWWLWLQSWLSWWRWSCHDGDIKMALMVLIMTLGVDVTVVVDYCCNKIMMAILKSVIITVMTTMMMVLLLLLMMLMMMMMMMMMMAVVVVMMAMTHYTANKSLVEYVRRGEM